MRLAITSDSATIGTTEYSLPADSTVLAAQTDDCELQAFIGLANMAAGDWYHVKVYEKVNGGTARPIWESFPQGLQQGPLVTPWLILGDGWDVTVRKLAGTDRSISWSLRKRVEGETIVISDDGITAAKIADNAIDSGAIDATAVTEFQSGLATTAGLAAAVAPLALSTQVDTLEAGLAAVEADTQDLQSRTPAALVGGRMDARVGAMADDVVTAAVLAADAATEIATAVANFVVDSTGAIPRTVKGVLSRVDSLITGKATGLLGAVFALFRADGVTKSVEATQNVGLGTRDAATTVAGD